MEYTLSLIRRSLRGKRAKHLHTLGEIPAVIYGHGIPAEAVQVKRSDFLPIYRKAGRTSLIDLMVDSTAPVKAIIQDVQVHPISLEPFHIDFRQIRMDEALTVSVPIVFVGESPAVKELAGTLVHPLTSVMVHCLPADLPHALEVDLSALQTFQDVVMVQNLKAPTGVTILNDATATVAVVTPPLTEEQLKKLEETIPADVSSIKTEAEEKKAAEAAKAAEESAAASVATS